MPYGDKLRSSKGDKIGYSFHSFRHRRITEWVKMGFSDSMIQLASGHHNVGVFRRYVHPEAVDVMRLVGDRKNKNYKNDIKVAQTLGGEAFLKYS